MTHKDKEKLLIKYSHNETLIETGTFQGVMAEAMRLHYTSIHTIEIDPEIAGFAKEALKDFHNVVVYNNDSRNILKLILKILDTKCTIWLDAHGNFGESTSINPLIKEVNICLSDSNKHDILIDDIDLLGKHDFPTMSKLKETIVKYGREYSLKDNVMIIE